MCDYSLHAVRNRLAVEGEQLVTHRFPTGSIGLASPADLEFARRCNAAKGEKRSLWEAIRAWLSPSPPPGDSVPAVCIPPGARLRVRAIPKELQKEMYTASDEEVVFVQLSASAYRYRDGIRFPNGREVLLQYLDEGMRVDVLSLASAGILDEAPVESVRVHAQ